MLLVVFRISEVDMTNLEWEPAVRAVSLFKEVISILRCKSHWMPAEHASGAIVAREVGLSAL
jgi:hypothetical protein